jgi:O-antigen ligase
MVAVTLAMALFAGAAAIRAEDELGIPLVSRVAALAEARDDQTVGMRVVFIQDAWSQFMEHPLLGSALEERNSMTYPHNVNVEAFMATGVFGGAAFLALTVAGLWASVRLLRRDPDFGWIALLYIQSLAGASTSGSLVGSSSFFAFLAAAVSTASRGVRQSRLIPGIGNG